MAERASRDEAYRRGLTDAAKLMEAIASSTTQTPLAAAKTNHNDDDAKPKPRLAPTQPYQPKVSDAYLRDVAQRCRLKQRIAEWAAALPHGPLDDVAHDERDRFEAEAHALPHCTPWMLPSAEGCEADPEAFEMLALAYEAAALTAEAFRRVDHALLHGEGTSAPTPPERTTVFSGATVQSALRVTAHAVRDGYDEPEQRVLFRWLRGYTAWRQVYISRHMRLDDPASPEDLAEVIVALRDLIDANPSLAHQGAVQHQANPSSTKKTSAPNDYGALRYHAKQAAEGGFMADYHWERLRDIARPIVEAGLPADTSALREALAPLAEHVTTPDDPNQILHDLLATPVAS